MSQDCRQVRRESHVEVLPDRVVQEPLPLPEEIVVVGDRRRVGFRDELRQGDAQR